MTPTWGCRGLEVRYGATVACQDVSFEVAAGTVAAVVGGDGAGKTSLLRALAGTVRPAAGTVRRPAERRLGYVSAGPGVWADLTVDENLRFAGRAYGLDPAELGRRIGSLLERTGLATARDRLAGQLSGGMRQKLALAMAVAHQPDLLILDEPTTGVDPVSRAELWRLLAASAAGGAAVVVATTYLDEAERAAHRAGPGPGPRPARRHPRRGPGRHPRPGRRGDGPAAGRPLLAPGCPLAGLVARRLDPARVQPGHPRPGGRGDRGPAPPGAGWWIGAGGMSTALLASAEGATRRFGELLAVDQVDLAVAKGEVVGLIGANGSGKTTLIRMLLGLLAPTAGHIRLFGEPPSRRTRARLGYVPQSLGLYEDLTVAENLAFSAAAYGSADARLEGELAEARDTLVGDLPLGLRRRAAFAIALGHLPDLLVLDEPTSGVDPLQRARLWETIRASAEHGAGVLVTTHHLGEAEQCDRLVVLAGGRVVAAGSLAGIVGDATAAEVRTLGWEAAFTALDQAGLPVSLVGRTLRVPAAEPAAVQRLLAAAGVPAEVAEVPASFEETFVTLAS